MSNQKDGCNIMNKFYKLKISLLIILFAGSFFLPAYTDKPGYECAQICFQAPFEASDGNLWQLIYYPIFNATNLLTVYFIISLVFFATAKRARYLKVLGGLLILHLLSWPILHLIMTDSDFSDIQIGYYLWAFSIIVIWMTYCLHPTCLMVDHQEA